MSVETSLHTLFHGIKFLIPQPLLTRVLHRYRRGQEFESCTATFILQLQKLSLKLRQS